MNIKIHDSIMIVAALFSTAAYASDYFRLLADLNGDDVAEVITVSTFGTGDFQDYSIRINNASTYNGKFFAAEGDLPQITLFRIDYTSGNKELLITTFEPNSCNYELLSYTQGHLVSLLHTISKKCEAPQSLGNGNVVVSKWERFWSRHDSYSLNSDKTKLIHDTKRVYPVGVPGVALELAAMESAGCKSASISKGSFVVVKDYDIEKQKYLITNLGNACGWVLEEKIHKSIGELPWAD